MLPGKQLSLGATGITSFSSKLTYTEMVKATGKNRFQLLEGSLSLMQPSSSHKSRSRMNWRDLLLMYRLTS